MKHYLLHNNHHILDLGQTSNLQHDHMVLIIFTRKQMIAKVFANYDLDTTHAFHHYFRSVSEMNFKFQHFFDHESMIRYNMMSQWITSQMISSKVDCFGNDYTT